MTDLLHYWRIVHRSWPLLVGLPLVVGIVALLLGLAQARLYSARWAMLVTQDPLATNPGAVMLPDYNNAQNWIAAEYIGDDIVELVRTQQFAQDIAGWVQQQHGITLDPDVIDDGLRAERRHRMVYLSVAHNNPQHTVWIGQGAVNVLRQNGLAYWGRADTARLNVSVLDHPHRADVVSGATGILANTGMWILLAGLLAVMIAFMRHAFDQHVRRPADLETLGFDIIGVIPKERAR